MWRLRFVYFHPIVEFEDECFLHFGEHHDAWRMYEHLSKSYNVLAVYKPEKII